MTVEQMITEAKRAADLPVTAPVPIPHVSRFEQVMHVTAVALGLVGMGGFSYGLALMLGAGA